MPEVRCPRATPHGMQRKQVLLNSSHQETSLIESLSVEENIALANGYQRRGGVIDWGRVRRFARAALDKMGR